MCAEPTKTVSNEKKKTVSLLKRKTNFDRIKEMSVDELAEKLAIIEANAACVYCSPNEVDYLSVKIERKKQWLEYLGSETEK